MHTRIHNTHTSTYVHSNTQALLLTFTAYKIRIHILIFVATYCILGSFRGTKFSWSGHLEFFVNEFLSMAI